MNMIKIILATSIVALFFDSQSQEATMPTKQIRLFNGKNLDGWEGDKNIWRGWVFR